MSTTLISVENLVKYFPIRKGVFKTVKAHVHAVDDVSFTINKGEVIGLVGESGCGKSTVARLLSRLENPTSGSINYLYGEYSKKIPEFIQIIFQDPYSSLNPRKTILDIVASGIRANHLLSSKREIENRVKELLSLVGLSENYIYRYPHEFSGGQRQRIGIARALALNPQIIVCDEPVSALDVSVQAQIINLLESLQEKLSLSLLFIAHDLSVVKHVTKKIMVMYLGKIVERASTEALFENPLHPYTKALISAIPLPDPTAKKSRILLEGDVETPINPPPGCRFAKRCYMKQEKCLKENPPEREIKNGHYSACHFAEQLL